MIIYFGKILCPQKHELLVFPWSFQNEPTSEHLAEFEFVMRQLLEGARAPGGAVLVLTAPSAESMSVTVPHVCDHCPLCHAHENSWTIDIERTACTSIEEATALQLARNREHINIATEINRRRRMAARN